jgi:hypothetical protein
MANRTTRLQLLSQPLDRTAILIMLVLSLAIGAVILKGDRVAPHVRAFSWQGKQIGAEDTAFLLTFSRPMDHGSVEENLRLDPPLPGKISWAGRRMSYTLNLPAPYGTAFELKLQQAHDRFSQGDTPTPMQTYVGQFHSRDRAFIYLGVKGEEAGRLVLYNLTQAQHQILTPANLVVIDFKPYSQGDRILFAANDRDSQAQNLLNQQLYTVSTGMQIQAPQSFNLSESQSNSTKSQPSPSALGTVERVLDSQDYQNLKFDLSADGQKILVQRVSRKNPAEFGIWLIEAGQPPRALPGQPGGDFLIAPDSSSLAINQGQGVAILPLEADGQPLDFLSQFGQTLRFARDGSAAAMVKFSSESNTPVRSLFLVTNQGTRRELLKTDGDFLSAQFHPTLPLLYCLYTKVIPGKDYLEQPYLAAIDLKTAKVTDLLVLPIQRDVRISLAPDGLGILFDQIVATAQQSQNVIINDEGKAVADSSLWVLPLVIDAMGQPLQSKPEPLPLSGLRPQWLP